jgi:hypothetical protein
MWRTRYPIAELDEQGNGMVKDGPTAEYGGKLEAVLLLIEAGVELPRLSDTKLVLGADGLTTYVASKTDGHWYAAIWEE